MMKTASELGFRMPAEWHPHERCWIIWPRHQQTWESIGLARAEKAYAAIATAIRTFEPLTMIVHPEDRARAESLCPADLQFLELPVNDSWARDTGATFLLDNQGALGAVDWIHNAWGGNYADFALDNDIAAAMIHATKAQGFKAPLVMEGGSFHVDGVGTVLSSKECLFNPNRNPQLKADAIETALHQFLGTEKAIWLNRGLIGDETDGHIDELACFVGEAKVLCLITKDKADQNYDILQDNLDILRSARDAKGRALEVYTVEQPPATYLAGQRLTLSYINFYLANQGIVMPAFGHEKADRAAYELFRNIFSKHTIKQIPALDIFAGGGGIHCITQQQPQRRV